MIEALKGEPGQELAPRLRHADHRGSGRLPDLGAWGLRGGRHAARVIAGGLGDPQRVAVRAGGGRAVEAVGFAEVGPPPTCRTEKRPSGHFFFACGGLPRLNGSSTIPRNSFADTQAMALLERITIKRPTFSCPNSARWRRCAFWP